LGVEEVRWVNGSTEWAENYTFFMENENEDHQLGTGFFVHIRIISAVRRIEFVSDRMYIILRCCWCNIIVLNVLASSEDKGADIKGNFYEKLGYAFGQFPRYSMKILLGDFNAKVGREDIFKLTVRNKGLPKISHVRSTMFCHCEIHKYTWTSAEETMHNQIHILIDGR
jgi:hypothetical protein